MVFDAMSVNIYQACADPEPFFQSSGKGWKGCLRFPVGGGGPRFDIFFLIYQKGLGCPDPLLRIYI